jgi:hypothetical protein
VLDQRTHPFIQNLPPKHPRSPGFDGCSHSQTGLFTSHPLQRARDLTVNPVATAPARSADLNSKIRSLAYYILEPIPEPV